MENSSNNNWITLLRRKIQKKFKRNRQKTSNADEILENIQTPAEEVNQIPEQPDTAEQNEEAQPTVNDSNSLSHNCEEMKRELYKLNWYWANLSRVGAQKILSSRPNGSFLVRDSCSEPASFTLSFRTNSKTFHCRNQWSQILTSSTSVEKKKSIIDVIEETIKKSQSQVVGFVKCDNSEVYPIAVRLIYPVVRENLVPSLQNICLSLLAKNVNESNINSLPLPIRIKEYVRESYNTL